ncbi:MAG: hypothetical protein IT445_01370 [Phycisphaeraceae bacterium]|nr:hypothetical protein [Phycisphaeraceae bacterium]
MKRLLIHLVLALGLLSYSSGAALAAHRALAHHHHHAHHQTTGSDIGDDCRFCQLVALRVIDTVDAPVAPGFYFMLNGVLLSVVDGHPHAVCLSIEQPRAPPAC